MGFCDPLRGDVIRIPSSRAKYNKTLEAKDRIAWFLASPLFERKKTLERMAYIGRVTP